MRAVTINCKLILPGLIFSVDCFIRVFKLGNISLIRLYLLLILHNRINKRKHEQNLALKKGGYHFQLSLLVARNKRKVVATKIAVLRN